MTDNLSLRDVELELHNVSVDHMGIGPDGREVIRICGAPSAAIAAIESLKQEIRASESRLGDRIDQVPAQVVDELDDISTAMELNTSQAASYIGESIPWTRAHHVELGGYKRGEARSSPLKYPREGLDDWLASHARGAEPASSGQRPIPKYVTEAKAKARPSRITSSPPPKKNRHR